MDSRGRDRDMVYEGFILGMFFLAIIFVFLGIWIPEYGLKFFISALWSMIIFVTVGLSYQSR